MSQPNPQEERATALEEFWNHLTPRQEQDLLAYFINEREYNMQGITKGNVEELFDLWIAGLTLEEIEDIL